MLRCIRLRFIVSGLLPTLLLGSCAAWASGFSSPVADEKTTRALSSARRLQGLDLGSFQNTYYFSSFSGDDANVCSAALPCQSYGYARGICTDYTRCIFSAGEWWSRYVLRLDSAAAFLEGEAVAWGLGDADRGGKILHWRLDGAGLGVLVLRMDRPLGHRDSTGVAPLAGEAVVGASSGSVATILRVDDTLIGTAPSGYVQEHSVPTCDPAVAPICRLFESSDPEIPAYIDGSYENPEDHAPLAEGGEYASPIFGVRGEAGTDGGAIACAGLRFSRFWNDVFSAGIASRDEARLLLVDCHVEKVFNDDFAGSVCGKGDSVDTVKCPGGAGTCPCTENNNGATTHGNGWIVGANVTLHNYMDSNKSTGATLAVAGSGGVILVGATLTADAGAVADSRPASAHTPWALRNVGGDVVIVDGSARAGGGANSGGAGAISDLSAGVNSAHFDPRGDAGAWTTLARFTGEPWTAGVPNLVPITITGPKTAPQRYLYLDIFGATFATGSTFGPGNGFSVGSLSSVLVGPGIDARIRAEGLVMDGIKRYFRFVQVTPGELERWHVTIDGAYDDDDVIAGGSFCVVDAASGSSLAECQALLPPAWNLMENSVDIGSETQPNAVDAHISMDGGETYTLGRNAIHPDRTEIYGAFVGQRRIPLPGQEFGYFPKEILGTAFDITELDLLIRVGGQRSAWSTQRRLTPLDAAPGDRLGASVAIDADTVVAGASGDGGSGSARVFTRSGTTWTEEAVLTAFAASAGDDFGASVAVDSDTALVGAGGQDGSGVDAGAAYAFVRSGSTWSEQAELTALDAAAGDRFGDSLALDGDSAVVGAPEAFVGGLQTGAAYVFVRTGTLWSQQAKLSVPGAAAGDGLGGAVAIHADTIVIGAAGDDGAGAESGAAYVFVRSGAIWSQEAVLTAANAFAGDRFGHSVAINADTALAGAPGAPAEAGSVHVFERSGVIWSQQAQLVASAGAAGDAFGSAVAVRGDTSLVGAAGVGAGSGAAYVFTRSGAIWSQYARVSVSDTAAGDALGASVALDGATLVAGASGSDAAGAESGAAYVRELFGSTSFTPAASLAGGRASLAFVAGPIVTIDTPVPTTPALVASALADATNAEASLAALGIAAAANGDELQLSGVHPEEVELLQDSDGDGLFNAVETGTGSWSSPGDTGTDPWDADTDDDGLLDGVETQRGVYVDPRDTGTDPHDRDTDADTYTDGVEVAGGWDPLDPLSRPPPIPALPLPAFALLALSIAASVRRVLPRRAPGAASRDVPSPRVR